MRKLCALLISVALVFGVALVPATAAAQPNGKLELDLGQKSGNSNGVTFDLPEAPVVEGKHALVPVRSIAGKLGGQVAFDKKSKQVMLTFGKTEIVMQAGKTDCYVNGKRHSLPIAPQQKGNNGTVFVPIRWLCETLGAKVDFLPNGKIKINWSRHHDEPSKPLPPVKPIQVAFQAVPQAMLQADLLQTNPDKPLLWYGPATNLLENSSFALRDKNILVVTRGWQGSTGYGIEVESLHVVESELVVRARLVNPAQGSFQATVMQYVYQALILPDKLPQIDSWRIETLDGQLLNARQLTATIPYEAAVEADVSWAALGEAGVVAKPVTVKGKDKLLVVIKRGPVPSTGYGIELQSLAMNSWGSISAHVEHTNPALDSFQAQVIRYPYQAVYVDPIYIGHEFTVALVNKTWDQLVAVPKTLKTAIDRSKRGVLVGYGRDLLHDPGVWADKLLLVAMRGYCPTGGYSITIDSLLRHDDNLVLVKVSEQDPAPGSMLTMAITYPYHIVEVPAELIQYEFQLLER